jgi:hypothetical protein
MVRRSRIVISAALALVVVTGGVSPVAAAGRTVYFGSPPAVSPAPDGPGTIRIQEPLVANQLTAFRLVAQNQGTSTLTQVAISGGSAVAATAAGPVAPYLTPGAAFVGVVPVTAGGVCALTSAVTAGDGFSCSFPNLARGQAAEIQVAVRAQPTAGDLRVVAAVTVKENRNDNGANPDTFYAVGSATALADNLDSVSTFLGPNQGSAGLQPPASVTATNLQQTTLRIPGAPFGQPAGISEVADPGNLFCAASYSCFGNAAVTGVNYGNTITPYLEWRMDWSVALLPRSYNERKGGVIHREDDGTFTVIPVRRLCSATVATDCVVSFGYNADKTIYSIVFRTPDNGGTRGF